MLAVLITMPRKILTSMVSAKTQNLALSSKPCLLKPIMNPAAEFGMTLFYERSVNIFFTGGSHEKVWRLQDSNPVRLVTS